MCAIFRLRFFFFFRVWRQNGSDGDGSFMDWDGDTSDDNSGDEYSGDEVQYFPRFFFFLPVHGLAFPWGISHVPASCACLFGSVSVCFAF